MDLTVEMDLFEKRLAECAKAMEVTLDSHGFGLMCGHARELISWNKKMNLTAIRKPELIAEKHFTDALAVSRFLSDEARILDMGSGGGFPGIPLKVMRPEISFVLADAVRKKVTFLNHVIRTLGLKHIRADHSRVEDMALDADLAGTFDAVISRGFAQLDAFVALALPMLKPGGTIWALKGEGGRGEITPELEQMFHIHIDGYCLPFEKAERMLIRLTLRT